jgi:hypothetical protein
MDSHVEETQFRANKKLKECFLNGTGCVIEMDENIFQCCQTIKNNPICRNLGRWNELAIYLAAVAATKNYGVISDHSSTKFSTVHDLCSVYDVHSYTQDRYFGLL